jgi:RNA polymerase sigma-70 factor (ECF subfamily)
VEALRLALMLTEYEPANRPATNALIALMCFHASRFSARQSDEQSPVLYEQQDESLWDAALISQGVHFLELSAIGDEISAYHLEARIASWHCIKEDSKEKWLAILQLYDQLLLVNYSPSVALNRLFALYKAKGPQAALPGAEKLNLEDNHFYFVLLGELYRNIDSATARSHFQKAESLAKTQTEKQDIQKKIDALPH